MSAPSIHTDESLLLRMQENDKDAFTAIYQRYWESLFLTAAKALRGREEAEDIVQDVFLSLWNRRHELKVEGKLSAYLQTSVRYHSIHYIEKNITRRDYLALLTDVAINTLPPDAEIILQLKEVQQTIHDAVQSMPPKMKEVYELSRVSHLTHSEIADKLGITTETVKKHIQHALQLIKTKLGYSSAAVSAILTYALFQ